MTTYTAPTFGPTTVASSEVRTGLTDLRAPLNGGLDSTDNITSPGLLPASKLRAGAMSETWREGSDGVPAYIPVMVGPSPRELLGSNTNIYYPDHTAVRFYLHQGAALRIWGNVSFRLVKAATLTGVDTIDVQCNARLMLDGVAVGNPIKSSLALSSATSQGALSANAHRVSTSVPLGWHEVAVQLDFSDSATTLLTESLVHLSSTFRGVVVEAVYR